MSRERWAAGERAWGDHEPEPVVVALGPWRFELRGDELADLAYDGSAIARSIRAVARDRDWNTVPTIVESFAPRPAGDGVDLELAMRGLGADVRARLEVRADAARFEVRLVGHVAHRVREQPARPRRAAPARRSPGPTSRSARPTARFARTTFPVAISPHQPAMDIATLAWTHDGVATRVAFDGDVFEMEDQRNWTDASYKTYSTPLSRPFPVVVPEGGVDRAVHRLRGRPRRAPRRSMHRRMPRRRGGARSPALVELVAPTGPRPR